MRRERAIASATIDAANVRAARTPRDAFRHAGAAAAIV